MRSSLTTRSASTPPARFRRYGGRACTEWCWSRATDARSRGVAAIVGVDEVFADRDPADKVEIVGIEHRNGPTIMVGDGINDAPALAAADVGVAIGARGSTASSEAADVVLTVDRLDRLGEALDRSPGGRSGSPGRASWWAWASPCSPWESLHSGWFRPDVRRSSRRASTWR